MTLSKITKQKITNLGKKLNEKNKNEILKKIQNLIIGRTPSFRSQSVNFSLAKSLMKKYTIDKDFLKKIKPSDEIIEKVLSEDIKNRDKRSMVSIKKEDIEKIMGYNMSDNLYELAIYLLFSSGRRTQELTNSKIKNIKKSNKLVIDNIIKRTDKNQNLHFITLIPKTNFLKNIKKFKKIYNYTNKNTFQRNLNRTIKRKMGEDFYPHLLRKMYANYLFKMRNTNNIAINPFIKSVLLQQSITSSLYYTGITFDFSTDIIKKNIV